MHRVALGLLGSAAMLIGWPNYFWGRHPYQKELASAAAPVVAAVYRRESYQAIGVELAAVVAVGVMVALMPLTWRLMPTTLERCGVLPRHLRRIWAYTMATVPAVMALSFAAILVAWTGAAFFFPGTAVIGWPEPVWGLQRPLERAIESRWVWVTALVWVWLVACQGWAFSRYLKLPRAWVVAMVLSIAPGMVAMTVGITIWISSVWH